MNIVPLIREKGFTVGQFATAAGMPEARLREIIFTDQFTMAEWDRIEKALGLRPFQLSKVLGKAPADFVVERCRKKSKPGKIIKMKGV